MHYMFSFIDVDRYSLYRYIIFYDFGKLSKNQKIYMYSNGVTYFSLSKEKVFLEARGILLHNNYLKNNSKPTTHFT